MQGPTIKTGSRVARFPRQKDVTAPKKKAKRTKATKKRAVEDLSSLSRSELLQLASDRKLTTRWKMSKAALLSLLKGD